jgi:hypothetical protein
MRDALISLGSILCGIGVSLAYDIRGMFLHWIQDPTDPWGHDQQNCRRCTGEHRPEPPANEETSHVVPLRFDMRRFDDPTDRPQNASEVPTRPETYGEYASRVRIGSEPVRDNVIHMHIHDGMITGEVIRSEHEQRSAPEGPAKAGTDE